NDLVPVFPWFGVFLLAVLAARVGETSRPGQWLSRVEWPGRSGRGIKWLGRHSLMIYLVHQPLMLAVIFPLAQMVQPGASMRAAEFIPSCIRSCELGSGTEGFCRTYCDCSLEQIETNRMWD